MKPSTRLALLLVGCVFIAPLPVDARPKRSIRSVDFHNFTFENSDSWMGKVALRNGTYQEKDGLGLVQAAKLVALKYVDFDGDGNEEVVVAIRTKFSGSMPLAMDYYVYSGGPGAVREVFHKWHEGSEGLCIKGKSLTIIAPFWDFPIPHCCPRYTEKTVYKWRGSRLEPVSRRLWKNYPNQNPERFKQLSRCG
jgi:hypothetical protein